MQVVAGGDTANQHQAKRKRESRQTLGFAVDGGGLNELLGVLSRAFAALFWTLIADAGRFAALDRRD